MQTIFFVDTKSMHKCLEMKRYSEKVHCFFLTLLPPFLFYDCAKKGSSYNCLIQVHYLDLWLRQAQIKNLIHDVCQDSFAILLVSGIKWAQKHSEREKNDYFCSEKMTSENAHSVQIF